ncbi:MAG TPA: hypothetical protein VMB78_02675 [Dissulfurispiraceae bacterium]|nr:hypothetical protein [Dissulfurispiraceae bacterium]
MNIPTDQIRYVDLPEVSETFVDSFGSVLFDGQTARIELRVTRMDEPIPPKAPTATKYPACRLVLTPNALLELSSNLQNIINALIKQGVLKPIQPEAGTVH